VNDPPMTFIILLGRWVGNTGCPTKSSTKGGHPMLTCLKLEIWGMLSKMKVNSH
jgi:hypothetical protein